MANPDSVGSGPFYLILARNCSAGFDLINSEYILRVETFWTWSWSWLFYFNFNLCTWSWCFDLDPDILVWILTLCSWSWSWFFLSWSGYFGLYHDILKCRIRRNLCIGSATLYFILYRCLQISIQSRNGLFTFAFFALILNLSEGCLLKTIQPKINSLN